MSPMPLSVIYVTTCFWPHWPPLMLLFCFSVSSPLSSLSHSLWFSPQLTHHLPDCPLPPRIILIFILVSFHSGSTLHRIPLSYLSLLENVPLSEMTGNRRERCLARALLVLSDEKGKALLGVMTLWGGVASDRMTGRRTCWEMWICRYKQTREQEVETLSNSSVTCRVLSKAFEAC